MLWELEEFQGAAFLGFVRNVPVDPAYQGRRWLPDVTTFDIDFEYIKGSHQKPVMAHVMAWDSEAPIHGRPGLGEKVAGELPPIKRKARIGEKELIRFQSPRAGTPDKQTAIDSVYALAKALQDAVQARMEWLRMQALSEDTIIYEEAGIAFEFDYLYNDELQINLVTQQDGAGTSVASDYGPVWTDTANATPIPDLQKLCDTAQDISGARPAELVLSNKYLGLLLNNEAAKTMIRGSTAPDAVLTTDELAVLIRLYNLPNIVTYDVKVNQEQDNGTYSEVRTMAENKAFLVPGPGAILPQHSSIGATLWGPTAESRPLIGTNLSRQAPGIYSTTYGTDEPPAEWVKSAAVAFPSIPGADKVCQMTLGAA